MNSSTERQAKRKRLQDYRPDPLLLFLGNAGFSQNRTPGQGLTMTRLAGVLLPAPLAGLVTCADERCVMDPTRRSRHPVMDAARDGGTWPVTTLIRASGASRSSIRPRC